MKRHCKRCGSENVMVSALNSVTAVISLEKTAIRYYAVIQCNNCRNAVAGFSSPKQHEAVDNAWHAWETGVGLLLGTPEETPEVRLEDIFKDPVK